MAVEFPEAFTRYCQKWHADFGRFQSLEAEIRASVTALSAADRTSIRHYPETLRREPLDAEQIHRLWWEAGGDTVPARKQIPHILQLILEAIMAAGQSR